MSLGLDVFPLYFYLISHVQGKLGCVNLLDTSSRIYSMEHRTMINYRIYNLESKLAEILLRQDKHHITIPQMRKSEARRKEDTLAVSASVVQLAEELTAALP